MISDYKMMNVDTGVMLKNDFNIMSEGGGPHTAFNSKWPEFLLHLETKTTEGMAVLGILLDIIKNAFEELNTCLGMCKVVSDSPTGLASPHIQLHCNDDVAKYNDMPGRSIQSVAVYL